LGLNSDEDDIEVGYRLMPDCWGKGYASEIAQAFINWGFEKYDLEKIVACCNPNNIASSSVLKKCGMDYVGKYLYKGEIECDFYCIKKQN